jgi:hypothetical protein
MEKLYHFYFDEGGMLGTSLVYIAEKKVRNVNHWAHISQYYFGKISVESICRHIELFHSAFPTCEIRLCADSEHLYHISVLETLCVRHMK